MPEPAMTVDAYLSVGANLEPQRHIAEALRRLLARPDKLMVLATSTFFRTAAIDRPDQGDYLNGVWKISTALSPRALKFNVLRPLEESLGRKRSDDKYAARPIDLDILLYGDAVIDEPGLKVPSEDIGRPFVAAALLELAPDAILPGTGTRISALADVRPPADVTAEAEFTQHLKEILR